MTPYGVDLDRLVALIRLRTGCAFDEAVRAANRVIAAGVRARGEDEMIIVRDTFECAERIG